MKTFIYSYLGIWINAEMYIRAYNQEDANQMFKDELTPDVLKKNTMANGDLNPALVTITVIKPGRRVVIICDGDY